MRKIYNKTFKILFVLFVSASLFSCKNENNKVRISGKLINFGEKAELSYHSAIGEIQGKAHNIVLNEDKSFILEFKLNKPTYFRLGRNKMYLSPGDNLQVIIDLSDSEKASFEGKGASTNNYMRNTLYPNGGSYTYFLDLKKDLSAEEIITQVRKMANDRVNELNKLSNISKEFKILEERRIKFDVINTYLNYPGYKSMYITEQPENYEEWSKNQTLNFKDEIIKNIPKKFIPSDIDIHTFRSIIYYINSNYADIFSDIKLIPEFEEYLKTNELLYSLQKTGINSNILAFKDSITKNIANEDYLDIIDNKFKKYETILPGKPAPDIIMTDVNGNKITLSGLKGKVVIVDVWATWCGPCLKEIPFYHELEEKYKDKDIHFISLSIESTREAWLEFIENESLQGKQFHIWRSDLNNYHISGIPRIFVFDKKLNIVDAFAPTPSTGKLEKLILKTLEK